MNTIFNTEIFNYKKISDTKTRTGISFAGFSLTSLECGKNSTGIMVQNLNIFNLNNIEVSTSTSTYADGGNILNKKYSSKTISITLFIQAENYNDLVHHIDILKQRTQISEGDLDIFIDGRTRRYTATLQSLSVPQFQRNDNFVEGVELEFLVTSPHWYYPEGAQTSIQDITSNISRVVDNMGNYKTFPTIYFLAKTQCHLTGLDIFHKNIGINAKGHHINITHEIHEGDILMVDYKKKIVSLNGTEIPFSGIMMPMNEGQSVFEFKFGGKVAGNIFILHEPTFL